MKKISLDDATKYLQIDLYDYDDIGNAVWKVTFGADIRFVEAFVDSADWDIVEMALKAFD